MKKWTAVLLAALVFCAWASAEEAAPLRYEFETGVMQGHAQARSAGTLGWAEGLTAEGDSVTVSVSVDQDGFYDLTFCQASSGGHKENYVLVDGQNVGVTIAESGAFQEHTLPRVSLSAGTHEVTVSSYWGYVKLDYLLVSPSEELADSLYDVSPVLSNPAPSAQAQALMDWMCDIYGEKMISGQYLDEYQYGQELKAVASVTDGLYPAMVGLDMMNYSPSAVSLGSWPTSVDQAIGYWKQGHILTMCWHWIAPEKYIDTTGNNWWGGYRTENTTLSLAKAMNGEDPEAYDLLIRDMDAIAAQLTKLRDAGVPVLWRPLHEASGGWFWWGASGPEAYIKLYRLMYERFTEVHGLNNLIWVWNGQSADWYPGDDVVDVIGEDIYPGHHAHDSQGAAFLRCQNYTKAKKLIMLSECGCVPSPAKCEKDGIMWSAWAVWCYEFVLADGKYSEDYTTAERMKLFYSQDCVVTLNNVPALDRGGEEEAPASDEGAPADASAALSWPFTDGILTGSAVLAGGAVEIRGNEETDSVTLTVSVPRDGEYGLAIVQAGIGGYKENYLSVDGEKLGNTVVQDQAEEACDFGPVFLSAGEHKITVTAFWGWVRLRTLTLTPLDAPASLPRYEFEQGELMGQVRVVSIGADQYVELSSNDETDGVCVTVTVPQDGYYDLTVVQAGIGGYKENYLAVDGERIENTVVQGTDREECVTPHVWLAAGEHTVTVTCFWGWANLDALIVSPSETQE